MSRKIRAWALPALCLAFAGCSATPRAYTPTLVVTDPALAAGAPRQEAVVATCDGLVKAGHRSQFRRHSGTAAGAGTAAGVGAGAVAVGSAVAGWGGLGIATLGVAAMPVVGILAAYGISRSRRARAERVIQQAMADCLAEHGYGVSGWERTRPAV